MPSVLIAGDVVPNYRTIPLFKQKCTEELFGEVIPYIKQADLSIVNLEAPIISGASTPIAKSGPTLHTSPETAEVLTRAGFKMVTLANNHFYDQGQPGVEQTIEACNRFGLGYIGGGQTLQEAQMTKYVRLSGKTLAVLNVCEQEFSIANRHHGGSHGINPVTLFYKIKEAREQADHVLVITHGGHEYYQLPSTRMQQTARFLIDAGADAVVNHHQHCYSGYETYKGKPIFYGLGNFCFDWKGKTGSTWNEGYFVIIDFAENISFRTVLYNQCDKEPVVKLIPRALYSDPVDTLNGIICNPEALQEQTTAYFERQSAAMWNGFEPYKGRIQQALFRRGFLPSCIQGKKRLEIINKIACESHRDILLNDLNTK